LVGKERKLAVDIDRLEIHGKPSFFVSAWRMWAMSRCYSDRRTQPHPGFILTEVLLFAFGKPGTNISEGKWSSGKPSGLASCFTSNRETRQEPIPRSNAANAVRVPTILV
jgi:hypothetical protein